MVLVSLIGGTYRVDGEFRRETGARAPVIQLLVSHIDRSIMEVEWKATEKYLTDSSPPVWMGWIL
jgi:hypothetical protein